MDPAVASGEMAAMVSFSTQPGIPLGHLDQDKLARGIAVMQNNGLTDAGVTPDDLVTWELVPAA
jgi:NitT/TauT family transport system substrate-binding protein